MKKLFIQKNKKKFHLQWLKKEENVIREYVTYAQSITVNIAL